MCDYVHVCVCMSEPVGILWLGLALCGHCLFGFRVVYGEGLFVTISPSRQHTSMVEKLSRARANDVSLTEDYELATARRTF